MKKILVIGGATIDLKASPKKTLLEGTSNIGSISLSLGGVAFNIARNLASLQFPVSFISSVGKDFYGEKIIEECGKFKIDYYNICSEKTTAIYDAVLSHTGELAVAIAAMDIFEDITPAAIEPFYGQIKSSRMVVCDTNIPLTTIEAIANVCRKNSIELMIDPTAEDKCHKLKNVMHCIDYLSPNDEELEVLSGMNVKNMTAREKAARKLLGKGVRNVIVSCGENGAVFVNADRTIIENAFNVRAVDVTGAGDSLIAAVIGGILDGESHREALLSGIAAASATIQKK